VKRNLTVGAGAAAQRLDVYLAAELGVSRSLVQRWLRAGAVTVNDQPVRASYLPESGDKVAVAVAPPTMAVASVLDLAIIYEDDDLFVIDKPAGLAAHGGNGRVGEATVADWARSRTTDPDSERPGIVHRLDRDTSGLLVIAKSAAAKEALQAEWRDRRVAKTYRLLAIGRVEPAEAVVNMPLDRDPAHPTRRRVSTAGRPAVTRYQTQATYPGYTYLEAYPETGRTHQLRVHFAALGHPVAGDIVYGSPRRPLGLERQFLHASRLAFTTPSGQAITVASDLPPDLAAVLTTLEETYN
jgi:23S rRNA pseudouridine1911/1915/1917 synthase